MNFDVVKLFFKSWGLYPTEEDCGDLNRDVLNQGLNRPCFQKMKAEAEILYGQDFAVFCSSVIDTIDDAFYVAAETWEELEEAFNNRPKV